MGKKLGSENVPQEQCNAIFGAVTMGVRVVDVAKYYNMPRSTVSNIVKRVGLRRGGASIGRRGRPNKLDFAALKRLELTLVSNRFLPLHTIAAIFNGNGSVTISVRRLRRYIRLVGFRNRSAVRKPFIREANLLKRTAWAMRHVH